MRPYRDIATLAGAQVVCFLALTHFEPNFFLIHLYQSVLYIAILVMLFYMEDRWAYMIGMMASVAWLGIAYMTGILGSATQQLFAIRSEGWSGTPVAWLAWLTTLIAILMVAFCGKHWMKEYSGLGKTRTTMLVSLSIVAVYYGILLRWFWDMIPNA
jgi:hypothetical protein